MPAESRRFYCDRLGADLVELAGAEAHHAIDVLRLRPGDTVELFDGRGTVAAAQIQRASPKAMTLAVTRRRQVRRAGPAVRLAFATPKGNRLDWLLEKAVELGAAALEPVVFERSVAGGRTLGEHKRQRWLAQCIAAAKQCGLDLLPEIVEPASLADYLHARQAVRQACSSVQQTRQGAPIEGAWLGLLGDTEESALSVPGAVLEFAEACRLGTGDSGKPAWTIDLLVGPEGGLTAAERAAALEAGMIPVRIGHTVLRIETAAVAMLSAVMAWTPRP
jgi:16S rRNA (uracil1498-N3)-methyltransferase